MSDIQGIFTVDGLPINGATAKIYAAATLGTAPLKDTALPVSGLLATVTTGVSHGFDGAYRFTGLTTGLYYVGVSYDGHILWNDHYVPVQEHSATVVLCAGFTPLATGADAAEVVVPYDPADGTTSIIYNVRAIDFRVSTAGGAPAITVQKSTVAGAFSATAVGTVTLGSGASEGRTTASLGTVASGNKLRFTVGTLGTATGWTVQCLLEGAT